MTSWSNRRLAGVQRLGGPLGSREMRGRTHGSPCTHLGQVFGTPMPFAPVKISAHEVRRPARQRLLCFRVLACRRGPLSKREDGLEAFFARLCAWTLCLRGPRPCCICHRHVTCIGGRG